ncbi:hypothetical protein B0H17DRAFT_1065490 [Mycena rosella]|uniref:Uncharacterized protein n=1 Tax=Mycena rosella TaxID=1033263 RepID=A0AAD7DI30_MYCRO|nr:hypothetical protein B0H17DRAFT_1065490 [Mycena rosella]
MGLGFGLVLTPAVSILSHYFHRPRALAAGIALSGSSVGEIFPSDCVEVRYKLASLSLALVASLSPSPAEIGLRIGVAHTTNSVGALVGIPIAGALLTGRLLWIRAIKGAIFFTTARYIRITRQIR